MIRGEPIEHRIHLRKNLTFSVGCLVSTKPASRTQRIPPFLNQVRKERSTHAVGTVESHTKLLYFWVVVPEDGVLMFHDVTLEYEILG